MRKKDRKTLMWIHCRLRQEKISQEKVEMVERLNNDSQQVIHNINPKKLTHTKNVLEKLTRLKTNKSPTASNSFARNGFEFHNSSHR